MVDELGELSSRQAVLKQPVFSSSVSSRVHPCYFMEVDGAGKRTTAAYRCEADIGSCSNEVERRLEKASDNVRIDLDAHVLIGRPCISTKAHVMDEACILWRTPLRGARCKTDGACLCRPLVVDNCSRQPEHVTMVYGTVQLMIAVIDGTYLAAQGVAEWNVLDCHSRLANNDHL